MTVRLDELRRAWDKFRAAFRESTGQLDVNAPCQAAGCTARRQVHCDDVGWLCWRHCSMWRRAVARVRKQLFGPTSKARNAAP